MGRTAGVNLRKSVIEDLDPKEKLYRVPDAQVRGLEFQVTPAGVKSWVIRFRVHGRQKTHTLGRWPELTVAQARTMAMDLQANISKGMDPAAARRAEREAETVAELVARFKKEHIPTLKPGTRVEYLRLLDVRILPALGSLRAKDVRASDVASFLSRVRSSTPTGVLANRVRAVLSKMFSLATVWGLRPDLPNPAHGQVRAPETKKDRHLSDRELVALGQTLRHLAPTPDGEERPEGALPPVDRYALAAIRLALLTGMRKSEIIGDSGKEIPALTWDAVDLEGGALVLDHHKTVRKVGGRRVSLPAPAVELLEHLPRVLGNPHVIPGKIPGAALVGLQGLWDQVRDSVPYVQEWAKVPKKNRVNISDVTIHDLRRSFASVAARMGYPELIVAALLGHAAGSVTAGYARLGADPLREVVEAIGARMAALLDGKVDLEAEVKGAKAAARARNAGQSA